MIWLCVRGRCCRCWWCTSLHTHTPHTRKHTYIHPRTHTSQQAHKRARTHIHTHAHIHIHTRTHTDEHAHILSITRARTRTHTNACALTHTHTHIHIHSRARTHTYTHFSELTRSFTLTVDIFASQRGKYVMTQISKISLENDQVQSDIIVLAPKVPIPVRIVTTFCRLWRCCAGSAAPVPKTQ